jgi:hypothetical protein
MAIVVIAVFVDSFMWQHRAETATLRARAEAAEAAGIRLEIEVRELNREFDHLRMRVAAEARRTWEIKPCQPALEPGGEPAAAKPQLQ